MSDDLDTLIRGIFTIGLPVPPSTCIFITAEKRMCGARADPQHLGVCADHWKLMREQEAPARPPPPPARRIKWTSPDDEPVVLLVAADGPEILDVIEDTPGGRSRPDLLAVAAERHEEVAELVRESEDPPPEEQECDHCGDLCDGSYCSTACRRADESDRG